MNARIRLNFRLLPVLTLATLAMMLFDGGRVWAVIAAGLGGAWLVSLWWARSLARRLQLVREMRFGWAQVGDMLEERFTLSNTGLAPALWVEVIDQSNLPEYRASTVTGVGGDTSNSWRTRGLCTRRGLYTLGPTRLETSDPLGIYTVQLEHPAYTNLMIVPPVIPLPSIEIAPGGRSGDGHPRRDAPERTVSAAGVREYQPGDSLHQIHWRTTARRETPFVHVFDGTPAGDWWVILDLDSSVQVGQGWDSTVEHGIILAASLADRGLRLRHAVGLLSYGETLAWLPPQPGEPYRLEILRALALAAPGNVPLAGLLERIRPSIGRRSSVMLITPSVSTEWIGQLELLRRRSVAPTVLLLDPSSFSASPGETAPPQEQEALSSPAAAAALLADLGIARYVISRDLLDRPELRPGRRGRWEWRISPSGRAIPVQPGSDTSGDAAWRSLS